MAGTPEHIIITKKALELLPAWERKKLGKVAEYLSTECCLFPDRYFDIVNGGYEKICPYTLHIEGIQFHYLPDTPIKQEYKFWCVENDSKKKIKHLARIFNEPNKNWLHASKGFTFYLKKSIECFKKDRFNDAVSFLGILLHVLQDAGSPLHSLEGPDGTDLFVLDRLFGLPGNNPSLLPSSILVEDGDLPYEITGYSPSIIGTSIGEIIFHLYTRYCHLTFASRRTCLPIIFNTLNGHREIANRLRVERMIDITKLCADLIHTVFCMVYGKIQPKDIKHLSKIYLSDMQPIKRPWGLSVPYRFITMLKDASLDKNRNIVPLKLLLNDRKKLNEVTFKKGFGTGSHYNYTLNWEIPKNVYRFFHCAIGLHSELGKNGEVRLEIVLAGKILFAADFNDSHPIERLKFPILSGGLLELKARSKTGAKPENNIVWGELMLCRK